MNLEVPKSCGVVMFAHPYTLTLCVCVFSVCVFSVSICIGDCFASFLLGETDTTHQEPLVFTQTTQPSSETPCL